MDCAYGTVQWQKPFGVKDIISKWENVAHEVEIEHKLGVDDWFQVRLGEDGVLLLWISKVPNTYQFMEIPLTIGKPFKAYLGPTPSTTDRAVVCNRTE